MDFTALLSHNPERDSTLKRENLPVNRESAPTGRTRGVRPCTAPGYRPLCREGVRAQEQRGMPRLRPNAPRAAWGRTVDIPVSFKELAELNGLAADIRAYLRRKA